MDTQVPIKRKSSRRPVAPETDQLAIGGGSNIPTYVAIGAAGLALGIGYLCMKKIQQQQTEFASLKEKEKQYETFQNQIKQLEENNQILYSKLQKSEQTQNRLEQLRLSNLKKNDKKLSKLETYINNRLL